MTGQEAAQRIVAELSRRSVSLMSAGRHRSGKSEALVEFAREYAEAKRLEARRVASLPSGYVLWSTARWLGERYGDDLPSDRPPPERKAAGS